MNYGLSEKLNVYLIYLEGYNNSIYGSQSPFIVKSDPLTTEFDLWTVWNSTINVRIFIMPTILGTKFNGLNL